MQKLFLLLFVLAIVSVRANAQTLVGLPQHGVTLAGTIDNVQINNASGRDIIGAVLHYRDVNGDGPIQPDLVTRHVRHNQALTSIPWGLSGALRTQKTRPIVSVTVDAVVFGDGEYVAAPASAQPQQNFDAFYLLSLLVRAEQDTGAILVSARSNPNQHSAAWERIAGLAAQSSDGGMDVAIPKAFAQRVAADLLFTKVVEGESKAFDAADRSTKLPGLWKKPTLARVLGLAFTTHAQDPYGTWANGTYTGDVFFNINVPQGQNAPSIGARALCVTPAKANNKWIGLYIGPSASTCVGGSDMFARVRQYPGTYTLQGFWEDFVPASPVGSGTPQAYWQWYNWCANIGNPVIYGGHCSYFCDGSGYPTCGA